MYESPIMAMVSDITTEMRHEQDREIMNAILSVGINVDKDELVKALRYDRQQYDKGYSEGYADAKADDVRGVGKWVKNHDEVMWWWECSNCKEKPLISRFGGAEVLSAYCPRCGAKLEIPEGE